MTDAGSAVVGCCPSYSDASYNVTASNHSGRHFRPPSTSLRREAIALMRGRRAER